MKIREYNPESPIYIPTLLSEVGETRVEENLSPEQAINSIIDYINFYCVQQYKTLKESISYPKTSQDLERLIKIIDTPGKKIRVLDPDCMNTLKGEVIVGEFSMRTSHEKIHDFFTQEVLDQYKDKKITVAKFLAISKTAMRLFDTVIKNLMQKNELLLTEILEKNKLLEKDMIDLKNKNDELQKVNIEQKKDLLNYKGAIVNMKDQINQLESVNSKYERDLSYYKSTITDLSIKNAVLQNKLTNSTNENILRKLFN